MYRAQVLQFFSNLNTRSLLIILALVLGNLIFTIIANASFKVSAQSETGRTFFFWQVIGNLAGLVTVITLTWLLRYQPLSIAFPLTTGLGIIGVQLIASHWLFGETVTQGRLLGALFIIIGIAFLSK